MTLCHIARWLRRARGGGPSRGRSRPSGAQYNPFECAQLQASPGRTTRRFPAALAAAEHASIPSAPLLRHARRRRGRAGSQRWRRLEAARPPPPRSSAASDGRGCHVAAAVRHEAVGSRYLGSAEASTRRRQPLLTSLTALTPLLDFVSLSESGWVGSVSLFRLTPVSAVSPVSSFLSPLLFSLLSSPFFVLY